VTKTMNNVLLHCCCAPCSLSCIDPLRNEGIEPVAFWYNPNIHPWKEYEARRNCLIDYASKINMRVLVEEDYGLREFVKNVVGDIDNRCTYCYETRLRKTAEFAAEHGFKQFTTTLLASVYQKHELIAAAGERFGKEFGVELPRFQTEFQSRQSKGKRARLLYAKILRMRLF
jgi:predicted adenine nucleotide alpha hydrolase (AANH) superfamily ATPase